MYSTAYSDINHLLNDLLTNLQATLGKELVGLYLHGSLIWGGFDDNASDIDLLAATTTTINQEKFDRLDRMQVALMQNYPYWEGRLEIAYLSTQALQTFKERSSQIAIMSPG